MLRAELQSRERVSGTDCKRSRVRPGGRRALHPVAPSGRPVNDVEDRYMGRPRKPAGGWSVVEWRWRGNPHWIIRLEEFGQGRPLLRLIKTGVTQKFLDE